MHAIQNMCGIYSAQLLDNTRSLGYTGTGVVKSLFPFLPSAQVLHLCRR